MKIRIVNLEYLVPSGVVRVVHWAAEKTEFGFTGSSYGAVNVPVKEPSDAGFIPLHQLTEQAVIDWVNQQLGVVGLKSIEQEISAQIESQKNPQIKTGLPWSSSETEL